MIKVLVRRFHGQQTLHDGSDVGEKKEIVENGSSSFLLCISKWITWLLTEIGNKEIGQFGRAYS